jgi:hypothetical protein
MQPLNGRRDGISRRPLEYIAFWQFLCFTMLICLIWTAHSLDAAESFFGVSGEDKSFIHTCLLTAGIIVVGFITVGHTYLQERRMLRGFIRVCSYCHKVEIEDQAWQQIEMFISDRSLAEFTHGVCPSCYYKQVNEMARGTAPTRPQRT